MTVVGGIIMRLPKLSKLELQIMDALWSRGPSAIREIQESFPQKGRPAYTTVQTMVYRLEAKKALRRARKIGNAHIFEPLLSRDAAQRRLVDEFLSLFGGTHAAGDGASDRGGNLTSKDVTDAEKLLRDLAEEAQGGVMAALLDHLLAIDPVRGLCAAADACAQQQWRAGAVLAVVRGLDEIPGALHRAGGAGRKPVTRFAPMPVIAPQPSAGFRRRRRKRFPRPPRPGARR